MALSKPATSRPSVPPVTVPAVTEADVSEASSPTTPPPADTITLENVRVRIQKRPSEKQGESTPSGTDSDFETVFVKELALQNRTLEAMREALLKSDLGRPEKDIFFPGWTKSMYICWVENITPQASVSPKSDTESDASKAPLTEKASDESGKKDDAASDRTEGKKETADPPAEKPSSDKDSEAISHTYSQTETVETDAALQAVLCREQEHPGSLCLLLQECRNARYSRKNGNGSTGKRSPNRANGHGRTAPITPPPLDLIPGLFYNPFFPYIASPTGVSPVHHSESGAVYYDRPPMTYAYPISPNGFGTCTPTHQFAAQYGEYAWNMHPPYVMPYVYPGTLHHLHAAAMPGMQQMQQQH